MPKLFGDGFQRHATDHEVAHMRVLQSSKNNVEIARSHEDETNRVARATHLVGPRGGAELNALIRCQKTASHEKVPYAPRVTRPCATS